jgi:hypothetical protein
MLSGAYRNKSICEISPEFVIKGMLVLVCRGTLVV